ncbi:Aste57867_2189 [Aphanomyces stellatus]|uniref:Aste57867_2189 protein n=1 Tax=Aphanomyces stellatus TaxID=120398 RepID=A0A485KCM4_9STRA|nr:hypothetical protein As57867_002184 [Aphanomyces stellatus]VFT79392.1 Aste57867_2189 [Aphanomyces stellatus]
MFRVDNVRKTGKIKLVRDDNCDIEHDSDKDHESTHVPLGDISAVRWWHRLVVPRTRFKIQSKVRYVDTKGRAHDGTVTKRHRDNTYDIRHLSDDETHVENVSIDDIHPISPWLQVLDKFVLALHKCVQHGGLGVGSKVEFQLDETKWKEGTIQKVRADGKYNIEYIDSDSEDTKIAHKIEKPQIRRRVWSRSISSITTTFVLHDGMRVEVTCTKDETEFIKRGEIVRSHGDDTKCVRFDDGKIEKHVLASRLRPLSMALCVGTKVDVTVETNSTFKAVQPKQGTIAWVHRDYTSVVLEIADEEEQILFGHNPFDRKVEALRLQGKPVNMISLRGYSLLRNINMLCNLVAEAFVYGWVLFGTANEIAQSLDVLEATSDGQNVAAMQQWYTTLANASVSCLMAYKLNNVNAFELIISAISHPFFSNQTAASLQASPPYLLLPTVMMDRYWLMALLFAKCVAFIYILVRGLQLLIRKGSAVTIRVLETRLYAQDMLRQERLWFVLWCAMAASSCTLVCFGSIQTTLGYYCLAANRTLSLTSHAFDISALDIRLTYNSVNELLDNVTAITVFNLYRGLCFSFVLMGAHDFLIRIVLFIPAMAATALSWVLVLASIELFIIVQHALLWETGHPGLTHTHDIAVGCIVASTWLCFVVYQVVKAFGEHNRLLISHHGQGPVQETAMQQAEEGMLGVVAQEEAHALRAEELHIQSGLVQCICAVLVPGVSFLLHVVAVFWLIVGVSLLHNRNEIPLPSKYISTSLPICCFWLVLLAIASLISCCVQRKNWKLLRQARGVLRLPVLLP